MNKRREVNSGCSQTTTKRVSFVLPVTAFCLLLVGSISVLAQVGGVKMRPPQNLNGVVPHNPRLKRLREGQPQSTTSQNSNLTFNSNTSSTPANRTSVTTQRRSNGAPVFLILGGIVIGFLALAGTAVVGFIIFKSVRVKRT